MLVSFITPSCKDIMRNYQTYNIQYTPKTLQSIESETSRLRAELFQIIFLSVQSMLTDFHQIWYTDSRGNYQGRVCL